MYKIFILSALILCIGCGPNLHSYSKPVGLAETAKKDFNNSKQSNVSKPRQSASKTLPRNPPSRSIPLRSVRPIPHHR